MIQGQFTSKDEVKKLIDAENEKAEKVGIPLRAVVIEHKSYQVTLIPKDHLEEFDKIEDEKKNDFAREVMMKFNSEPVKQELIDEIKKRYNEFSGNY